MEVTDNRPYKVTYTSPKSQNKFLGLLGDEIRTKATEEIKSADTFTIMADTTPDVNHKDQMSVICRYVNESAWCGMRASYRSDLKEIPTKTGADQAAAIISTVDSHGLA